MSLKFRIVGIVVISILMLAIISPPKVSAENILPFEHISIFLDCDKAQLTVACGIQPGNNTEIVHFPSSVNVLALFDVGCTRLYTIFGKKSSVLVFEFNNIGSSEAKARADQWAQLIETAFDTTFTWQYTNTSSTYVYVRYTNSGATNATIYSCLRQCLNWTYGAEKPLGGFSNAMHGELTHFAEYIDYSVAVGARKGSWGEYAKSVDMGLTVSYTQNVAKGTGLHSIDVLSLLGVTSLAPSPYALGEGGVGGIYSSTVFLTVNSSTPVAFVSCEPSPLNPSGIRGWYSTPSDWQFIFKDDPSPVSPLTFTFTGTIQSLPALAVVATASPITVYSGGTSTIKASLTSGGTAVTGATVNLTLGNGGTFSTVTDQGNGTYVATFTAPDIVTQTVCTIIVSASKSGYQNGLGQTQVTVQPLVINIYMKTGDGTPIAGATVVSTSQPSGQAALSGSTDANGLVVFTGILKGSYTIKASKPSYEDATWTGTVSSGQATTQNIVLSTPFPMIWVAAGAIAVVGIVIAMFLVFKWRKPKT
jgi:hypothetical protein